MYGWAAAHLDPDAGSGEFHEQDATDMGVHGCHRCSYYHRILRSVWIHIPRLAVFSAGAHSDS